MKVPYTLIAAGFVVLASRDSCAAGVCIAYGDRDFLSECSNMCKCLVVDSVDVLYMVVWYHNDMPSIVGPPFRRYEGGDDCILEHYVAVLFPFGFVAGQPIAEGAYIIMWFVIH